MTCQLTARLLRSAGKLLQIGCVLLLTAAGIVLALVLLRLVFGYHTSPYAQALPRDADGGLIAGLSIVPMLLVYAWILLTPLRIVDTIEAGTPFVPVNAQRLGRTACLALVLKLAAWTELVFLHHPGPQLARFGTRLEAPSLLVIAGLFVLAHVFRQGAAMREDLEEVMGAVSRP